MQRFSVARQSIPDVLIIHPRIFLDERGAFYETFRAGDFREFGIDTDFIQGNQSLSRAKGTIRGLHFQRPPAAQAKLLRVVQGAIFDVAVDLRTASPTFGRWCGATLGADDGATLYVPAGFAHGFCTLEPDTVVTYQVDAYYTAEHDTGIRWDDPGLAIDWPVAPEDAVLSRKDAALPRLCDIESPF